MHETPNAPMELRPRAGSTLAEKIWRQHIVDRTDGEPDLLYIDLHLTHEATSAQAFEGLRQRGLKLRRPTRTLAVEDHNVPTGPAGFDDPAGRFQIETLRTNCKEFDVELLRLGDSRQGIVHVVGPELGLVHPGMTVACGDSHTSTHGAFGALGFGIGASEVEHVFATQTLPLPRWKAMRVSFSGQLPKWVGAKDLMLALIARIGVNGASGHVVEFAGEVVRGMSMEARMTLCNMTIEAGGRAGLVAPDRTTYDYLAHRPYAPQAGEWNRARAFWSDFYSDADAVFDTEHRIDVTGLSPFVTWGTRPNQASPIAEPIPDPATLPPAEQTSARRAIEYMGLVPGTPLAGVPVDAVFLGSCTNGRLEDLRSAAEVLRGLQVHPSVSMIVVPGSMQVRAAAEAEGLHAVFLEAGAEWRGSGCSLCIGMNSDHLPPGSRCASTSNRNFEGRQGAGVLTHLVSPAVAAASAVTGALADPADLGSARVCAR